jgi:transcriptional regulator with XRE-family HTH domain
VPSSKEIAAELSRFGANIRRERTARNITQERLAERADLNIRTLQKIEAGELNVLITTAARIQRALACSWEKLMPIRVVS